MAESYYTTKVIEATQEILINQPVNKIMFKNCKYFGSSYAGRVEGTKEFIHINYKAPIILEETSELIFFPTASPRNETCHWINLKSIKNYVREKDHTIVTFLNDDILSFPISFTSFDNQYLRASKLLLALKYRKEKLKTGL